MEARELAKTITVFVERRLPRRPRHGPPRAMPAPPRPAGWGGLLGSACTLEPETEGAQPVLFWVPYSQSANQASLSHNLEKGVHPWVGSTDPIPITMCTTLTH